jgi:hypothetical protein
MQPASTVIASLVASSARMRFMRLRLISTARSSNGVAPPHRPVLPPCGTIATPPSAHKVTRLATSAVDCGYATSAARPL